MCEVKEILTRLEFKARGITPAHFPGRTEPNATSCTDTGSGITTSCEDEWAAYVVLTNGTVFGCDLVVSATGVTPNTRGLEIDGGELVLAEDGGAKVDKEMRTSIPHVYAAGDACSVCWDNHSNVWFQVKVHGLAVLVERFILFSEAPPFPLRSTLICHVL